MDGTAKHVKLVTFKNIFNEAQLITSEFRMQKGFQYFVVVVVVESFIDLILFLKFLTSNQIKFNLARFNDVFIPTFTVSCLK